MVDLKNIQMLLLDVDGVLTDGRIVYASGGDEMKAFNAKDGLGIRMLQAAGIQIGIVTGRSSPALNRRCEELGIRHLYDGVADKEAVLSQIAAETGIRSQAMAFVGDDLPDCPLMRAVGVPIAVADAHVGALFEGMVVIVGIAVIPIRLMIRRLFGRQPVAGIVAV